MLVCSHSFFWRGACEFPNIIIVAKKVNKQVEVNFIINRDHGKKSRETRIVIYTCRCSSGNYGN